MQEQAFDRARRGAEFLDNNYLGWINVIDPCSLDIDLCSSCIMAQLSTRDNYHLGLAMLGLSMESAYALGFHPERTDRSVEDAQDLTRAWLSLINNRKGDMARAA